MIERCSCDKSLHYIGILKTVNLLLLNGVKKNKIDPDIGLNIQNFIKNKLKNVRLK